MSSLQNQCDAQLGDYKLLHKDFDEEMNIHCTSLHTALMTWRMREMQRTAPVQDKVGIVS